MEFCPNMLIKRDEVKIYNMVELAKITKEMLKAM